MKRLWLVLLILLASLLRIPFLTDFPAGFTPDEAAFGYNAYSLLETGRDEWGTPWYALPFTNLRSFGDYKLPLYTFLAVPTVKIFGLTEFAVRLPNAILGVLAVAVVYVFSRRLFPRLVNFDLGLWSAFLIAISPWHIQLSRGAFEANLVTFFLPLGLALLISRHFLSSSFILAANFYSYHSARYLTPLILGFVFLLFPKLINRKLLLLLILLIPGLWSIFNSGSQRAADIAIFRPTDSWASVVNRRFEATQLGLPDFYSRLFSNRPLAFGQMFLTNYLTYFSPQFLFTQGAGESTYGMIPGLGVLYLVELPLLIASLILFIYKPSRSHLLIFGFLLIAPVAPALAKGVGSAANRAAIMIPFLAITNALGLSWLTTRLKIKPAILLIGFVLISFVSLIYMLENYYFHSTSQFSHSMLAGRREIITLAKPLLADYQSVRISRSLSEPHIYVAFFLQVDPRLYQASSKSWSAPVKNFSFMDQYDGYYLNKFRFGNLLPEIASPSTLLIGQAGEFPAHYIPIHQIRFPDGEPNLQISQIDL